MVARQMQIHNFARSQLIGTGLFEYFDKGTVLIYRKLKFSI
jgi:hypothetical protein